MPVANVKSSWQSGNLVFEHVVSTAAIHYGINGTGLDAKFWGDTASVYMLWDESADNLDFVGETHIDMTDKAAVLLFAAGGASSKAPSADAEAGWINVHVTAVSTTVYVPYWAS